MKYKKFAANTSDGMSNEQNDSTGSNKELSGVRTTGRIKKAKVVFDPSDNYAPKNFRRSSATSTLASTQSTFDMEKKPKQRQQIAEPKKVTQLPSSIGRTSTPEITGYESERCSQCHRREPRKGSNKLIPCMCCNNNVHFSCLKTPFEDINVLRTNFRCENCRICSSCFDGREEGEMITCVKCVKSYHFACHIPRVTNFANHSKWNCSKCNVPNLSNGTTSLPKSIRQIIIGDEVNITKKDVPETNLVPIKRRRASAFPGNNTSIKQEVKSDRPILMKPKIIMQVKPQNEHQQQDSEPEKLPAKQEEPPVFHSDGNLLTDEKIKKWSADEVFNFIFKYFPKEASVFKDADIDGPALLSLRRSDVINEFRLKLGSRVRLFNFIAKMQSNTFDPSSAW